MHRTQVFAITLLCLHMTALTAWAVKPATWLHEEPKDFMAGELENLVVSSAGQVSLSRRRETLHAPGEEAEVVNALVQAADGKVYAATGPSGLIYRISGDEVTEFAKLPEGGTVFSLLFTKDGNLLAGTGGEDQAKIYLINSTGAATVFYEPSEARYVWAMARGPQGEIYAATGIDGKIFVIEADGSSGKTLADVKTDNLLCLAFGPDGMLYAGTDEDGLIYRINPTSGATYVMYDAAEPEISSIVVDNEGNIFAATAAAAQARPGRTVADAPGGKPDPSDKKKTATQPAGGDGAEEATTQEVTADDDGKAEDGPPDRPTLKMTVRRPGMPVTTAKASKGGNAIYRIDPDGFVTEVFREPVMILGMTEHAGTIYAATGNEGRVYAITPGAEETVVLAKLKPKQVTCILRLPVGDLVCGTANAATFVQLSQQYATEGTLVSEPLDAGQIVKWGRFVWTASVPEGTKLTFATRSGNVEDTESDAWESWSGEQDATAPQQIASAGARFLQYRLTLATIVTDATPSLGRVKIARIEENRAPRLTDLNVVSAKQAAQSPKTPPKIKGAVGAAMGAAMGAKGGNQTRVDRLYVIVWQATDPNKDPLKYKVYYRELGQTPWIRIAKDLNKTLHVWDSCTVPDGRYEVRVVAQDSPGNPPAEALDDARISDPITVDNTPPDVTIGAVRVEGTDSLTISATMSDAASDIAEASYSVDSSNKWVPLAALDDIFDSPNEAVSFTIDDLERGPHRVALRVQDDAGNTRYVTQYATIGQ